MKCWMLLYYFKSFTSEALFRRLKVLLHILGVYMWNLLAKYPKMKYDKYSWKMNLEVSTRLRCSTHICVWIYTYFNFSGVVDINFTEFILYTGPNIIDILAIQLAPNSIPSYAIQAILYISASHYNNNHYMDMYTYIFGNFPLFIAIPWKIHSKYMGISSMYTVTSRWYVQWLLQLWLLEIIFDHPMWSWC